MPSKKRTGGLSESREAKRAKPNATPIDRLAGPVSEALEAAIKTAQPNRMVSVVLSLCETNPQLVEQLNELWLVKGKEVVRYHADTESEGEGDISDSEEDREDSDVEIEQMKIPKKVKATRGEAVPEASKGIAVEDEEFTARYATCMNCKEEFDVTVNEKGMCRWHASTLSFFLSI